MKETENKITIESNLPELADNLLEQIFEEIDLFCVKVLYEKESVIHWSIALFLQYSSNKKPKRPTGNDSLWLDKKRMSYARF